MGETLGLVVLRFPVEGTKRGMVMLAVLKSRVAYHHADIKPSISSVLVYVRLLRLSCSYKHDDFPNHPMLQCFPETYIMPIILISFYGTIYPPHKGIRC